MGLRADDKAAFSILVILLAATTYVWVSGFGSTTTVPAKSIAITSGGPIQEVDGVETKAYTIASASPGLRWSDLQLSLDGAPLPCADDASDGRSWGLEEATCAEAAGGLNIRAGQGFLLRDPSGLAGSTLRIVDATANSVMATLVVG